MFSQQISLLCLTQMCVGDVFGVQVYKMKQLLMHCPCLQRFGHLVEYYMIWNKGVAVVDADQNYDIVRLRNRSTQKVCRQ